MQFALADAPIDVAIGSHDDRRGPHVAGHLFAWRVALCEVFEPVRQWACGETRLLPIIGDPIEHACIGMQMALWPRASKPLVRRWGDFTKT